MTDRMPGFNTLAIHAGAAPDAATGARATPIYQTTSFVFDDVDHAASLFGLQAFGNIYSRIGNPTCAVLEERVAALEGGTAGLAVASGHAAEFLTMHALMQPGDEFVAANKLYGGSINQFNHSYKNFGWNVRWADADDPSSFEAAVTPRTKAFFVESIANPGGVIVDLEAIGAIAKRHNIPFIVDNTMASPYLIRPFEYGADIVVHSATKFLGGHGNSIGGVIVDGGSFNWIGDDRYPMLSKPRPEYGGMVLGETFGNFAFAIATRVLGLRDMGPALSPFNAFLILQGIETLPLRMQRHSDNALTVAEHLDGHKAVTWVSYPGLRGDRYHNLAKRYCPKGAGAVFTFGLEGGYDAGVRLVSNLRLFSHLANIGDTRSLVIHPASTTHRQLTDEQRKGAGAGPEVVRLSIGLEDTEDLIADLDQALDAAA
ncbi:MAG: O-acetylhomoserine aminocarboxypropyltransferase [Microvirga sp.]|jgi:O-acetylhomoserine (thiol)-lyase|nr:O-acetylhomoserine aminocarboxypropyltransferase [Beijerinckiaceae bacterium]